jgi:hypothetical protein
MMKTKICVLIFLTGIVLASSCSKQRSYSDMIKDQKRAIDKLIGQEGLEILKKYPSDSVFGEKQFVLLDNGVYLNVVDSGNGNRPVAGKTTILVRCSARSLFEGDSSSISLFPNGYDPMEFIYGSADVVISRYAQSYYSPYYFCLSTGLESALGYVGENSIVKLIVPFDEGSTYQTANSYGVPLYYDKVKFTFY